MSKLDNYILIRDFMLAHAESNEDGLHENSSSLIKICNAAIACYRLTGGLGDLAGAIKYIIEMLKNEGDSNP
ncbi:MAG: hypothetical protein WCJ01_03505 [Ignavibacteria bacterium]